MTSGGSVFPSAHDISRFSLRFHSQVAEQGFVRLRGERILSTLRSLSAHVAVVAFMSLASQALSRGMCAGSFATTQEWIVHRQVLLTMLAMIVLCLTFLAVTWLGSRFLVVRARLLEVVGCFYIPLIMVVAMATDRYYMTKIMGFPITIHGAGEIFSDTRVLLTLDATLSFVHLFVPIRWTFMVFVEILTVLIYLVLAFGIGSSERKMALSNTLLLVALTVSSAVGQRSIERRDRESFASIAQERILRVMAEAQTIGRDSTSEHGRAATSVVASTTPTDRFFIVDPADTALDVGERLGDIGLVGNRELWLLDHREVKLNPNELLGEGGFGLVVGGRLRGSPIAVKVPKDPANAPLNSRHFASLANQLRMLRLLRHPNIVMLYGACVVELKASATYIFGSVDNSYLALVLERVDGVSLSNYIERGATAPSGDHEQGPRPDDRGKFAILLGVCQALQYLHALRPGIVHGDLKPCNIMVERLASGPRAKLVDFGLSTKLTRNTKTLGGSLGWMPPEAINNLRPCMKSDVFALGRIMFFVICETLPIDGLSRSTIIKTLRKNQVPAIKWPQHSLPTPACKRIIEQCTAAAVVERPTSAEVAALLEAVVMEAAERNVESEALEPSDFHSLVLLAGRKSKEAAARKKKRNPARSPPRTPAPAPAHAPTPSSWPRGKASLGMPRVRNRSGGTLEAVAEEEEQEHPEREDAPCARTHECFDLTPADVRELTVVDLIIRWNISIRPRSCCKYHAALDALQDHVFRLKSSKCKLEYMRASEGSAGAYRQCLGCFLIQQPTPAPKSCEFCGCENASEAGLRGPPAPDRGASNCTSL